MNTMGSQSVRHHLPNNSKLISHLSGDSWMYPYQRTPMGNPYISPIYPYITWVFMGYYPQESLYFRPISTMGTRTLGVHPSLSLESTNKVKHITKLPETPKHHSMGPSRIYENLPHLSSPGNKSFPTFRVSFIK